MRHDLSGGRFSEAGGMPDDGTFEPHPGRRRAAGGKRTRRYLQRVRTAGAAQDWVRCASGCGWAGRQQRPREQRLAEERWENSGSWHARSTRSATAIVERAHDLAQVPCRPALELHLSMPVSSLVRDGSIS